MNTRSNAKSGGSGKRGETGKLPRFGAHMSVAGGLENAFTAGQGVGCDCIQIFVKNQRQWRAGPLTDEQVARFRAARSATGLAPVIAHASYLLNLASPARSTRDMSINAMVDELTRCEALGVESLVFHPGSHLGPSRDTNGAVRVPPFNRRGDARGSYPSRDREGAVPRHEGTAPRSHEDKWTEDDAALAGIERIAESLDEVHRRCPGFRTVILLETTAGQGSAIGWHFEQLAAILDRVRDSDRLGVCLDTCHLFAAGYDFRTADGYAAMIDAMDQAFGLARVRCIHTNDSKKDLGSRVDRHEHIGKGKIGKAGLAHFVNDPRFRNVPFILETPKGKDGRGTDLDKANLKRLRSMIVD